MPWCADFLQPRKSRLGPLKSTFNAKNFIRSSSMSISIDFGAIRFWSVSRSSKSPKKLILAFKVIQCHWIRWQSRASVRPISHRYWDTATCWIKIAIFYPLSLSALVRGDSIRIYGKALRFLKLEFSGQPTVKFGDPGLHRCDWFTRVTEERTDRQNCDG